MTVASLELCKQLYKLSNWKIDEYPYAGYCTQPDCPGRQDGELIYGGYCESCSLAVLDTPAYDLGFLLRKLPKYIPTYKNGTIHPADDYQLHIVGGFDNDWISQYAGLGDLPLYIQSADTPENALCKLAIELFKQGILKRESEPS